MLEAKEFSYQVKILEAHLDTFGHVNNAVYLQLYEEARWDFIQASDHGLRRILSEKIGPVVLEVNVKFRKELTNRELITITSKSTSLHGKILTLEQKMIKENGQIASMATFTVGIMDLEERKLIDPPERWLEAVGIKVDSSL